MSSGDRDGALTSQLIERLLVDPAFRTEFRRDPVAACVAAGLPDLAADLAGSGNAIDTLMVRESRSSLAGVVMAVAVEGMSFAEAQALIQHGLAGAPRGRLPHGGALRSPLAHLRHAASPVALQRQLGGLRGGSPGHGVARSLAHGVGGSPAHGVGAAAPHAGGASPPAAAAAHAPAASAAPAAGGPAAAPAQAPGVAAAQAPGVAAAQAPGVAAAQASGVAAAHARGVAAAQAPGVVGAHAAAAPAAEPPAGLGGQAPGVVHGAAEPAPPNPGAQPIDGGAVPAWPDQHPGGGGAVGGGSAIGGGGAVVGGALVGAGAAPGGLTALLTSPQLSAPPNVRAFLAFGGADPRMVSVLDSALANHTIGLGQVVAVSDPVHAQAVDIVSVDGQPVGANNFAARDLVTEIAALDPSVRPSEIGTPWPIRSEGFFSDPRAMDRLHLAFEMPGTGTPPAGSGAQAAGALSSPVTGQVAYQPPVAGQVAAPGGQLAGEQSPAWNPGATPGAGAPLSSVVPAPIAASTPGAGADAALAYARAMIGKLPESAGNNLGPQLDRFEADFGFHGAPWCGIFAGHVMEAAGLKVPHTVASVASILDLARNGDPPFVKGVMPVSEARPGDLVTFGGTEHVAVVTKVDAAGVHTIAGNTGQSNVSETTYSPGSVTGVVRPDYAAGKPGSIAGVWDYSGAQPPAAGAPARAPGAGPLGEAPPGGATPGGATPGGATPGGATPGAPAAPAVTGAPLAPPPAVAEPPTPHAPPPEPGAAAFNRPAARGGGRHTVQFLRAVQPSPGSPLFGQAPRPVEVAPGAAVAPEPSAAIPPQPTAAIPPEPSAAVTPQPSAATPSEPSTANAPQPVAGGVLDQAPTTAPPGGSISVSSSLLTSGQAKFAGRLAELTGLDPRVVAAWELAEESGGAAQGREAASNFNWLNIGYFDSGAGKIAFDETFSDPVSAAEQSAKFLRGEWGGASPSIRAILNTVGHTPDEQMAAIANSDWASSHYGGGANLHGTYNELGDMKIENSTAA